MYVHNFRLTKAGRFVNAMGESFSQMLKLIPLTKNTTKILMCMQMCISGQ